VAEEKSKPLFEAIIRNDDKKAKMAYGRAVHVLPEAVQFAVDLRFKNYEHASQILPKLNMTDSQKTFWEGILKQKPPHLAKTLCENLKTSSFPEMGLKASEEEMAWLRYYDEVSGHLINSENGSKELSPINKDLSRVSCNERECLPLNDDLRDELLRDSFFDEIHNKRRRDTRFYAANIKSPLKLGQYSPYVLDMSLLKFYKALKATTIEKQMHFLRRFKGIARDMRNDTILSRSIADIILGDDQDLATAKRLGVFLTSQPLIASLTRIEGELPSCGVK
jgi:hypothetical protein